MPTCWIIAGPNGAGKTTFALEYLPKMADCQIFVNADLIAAGLSPLAPENELVSASRLFLSEIKERILRGENFSFETTLSGRIYLSLITRLRSLGWRVELLYLALPSIEFSKQRVAERVKHGGHNIPIRDIERRFSKSLYNLINEFGPRVDRCRCFMNTGDTPELIFEQLNKDRLIANREYFELLLKGASGA